MIIIRKNSGVGEMRGRICEVDQERKGWLNYAGQGDGSCYAYTAAPNLNRLNMEKDILIDMLGGKNE